MFELVELVGERLNPLHLVVDHLDVFRDFLRRVDDRLNVHGGIEHDPLRACRHGDPERHERECDDANGHVSVQDTSTERIGYCQAKAAPNTASSTMGLSAKPNFCRFARDKKLFQNCY